MPPRQLIPIGHPRRLGIDVLRRVESEIGLAGLLLDHEEPTGVGIRAACGRSRQIEAKEHDIRRCRAAEQGIAFLSRELGIGDGPVAFAA